MYKPTLFKQLGFKQLGCSVLLLLATAACANPPTEQQARALFSLQTLNIGGITTVVQVADTAEKRAQGLMFQQTAKPGMLLLYQQPAAISLWMRNTTMPLDVAFIGPDWTIMHIEPLQPLDETTVAANSEVIAALEMPQGWFAAKQIQPGATVKLIE
ncbi:DUF192 domain-containing protein [Rheinheimera salexigens]|uniref:DUF192 domain-containing protein n=1 Tax=Rheinheimera salexigens TaxID=1628148 RepID=A0A1E7Q4A3_9GAMM|nr:DUF192 domain-containing protein [Rheinheimera salexigens]OEY68951.1 hypothetical protein BI198_04740 [Rheinheimera salexigens]